MSNVAICLGVSFAAKVSFLAALHITLRFNDSGHGHNTQLLIKDIFTDIISNHHPLISQNIFFMLHELMRPFE